MDASGLPMRPWKLRLAVLRQTSPSARMPSWMPTQAPQPGLVTTAPASQNTSNRPSAAAAPAQQPRRRAQVGQPAVGARADEHLVDPGALELRGRRRVVDGVRPGHHRDDGAGVELDDALVGGAGVGGAAYE